MMDNMDKFKDDSPGTGADGRQKMDGGSLCGDLAKPHVISHCPWGDIDTDMGCSSDDSNSERQEQESIYVLTENGQSYHAQDSYSTTASKVIDGEFVIGIRETISKSAEYCIWDSMIEETANRQPNIKAASDKSKSRRSRIQAVVIVAAFVLSSIVLLCVLILALV